MLLSYYLRPKFEWIDPFICGMSLLIRCLERFVKSKHCSPSIPLLVLAVQLARDNIMGGFIAMFFGMFFLNTNW